ncbi:hypothetical protein FA95DRAFT_440131 [Auriscalpium vulgare]|uniref:Uncharacterized protein n=1 Tax=Auriscalpium vulgare TaxID=40419 RepID=A0ACB8RGE1_9AGAM|nr:hypothetical protein FA95DRAFT_440131 [Auriscalpium vulgare]
MAASEHTYEIAIWAASAAFQQDPDVLVPGLHYSRKRPGLNEIFYGSQLGAPNAFLVAHWDSLAAHQAFVAETAFYESFIPTLAPARADTADPISLVHALFPSSPVALLSAPLTEFATVTPKPGRGDAVRALVERLAQELNAEGSQAAGAVWAPIVEEPERVVLVVGWPSHEVHAKAVEAPKLKELIGEIVASSTETRVQEVVLRAFAG